MKNGINHINCRICGAKLRGINGLHLSLHNLTAIEYRKKFPGALVLCEKSRLSKRRKIRKYWKGHPEELAKKKIFLKQRRPWNKGLTKEVNESVRLNGVHSKATKIKKYGLAMKCTGWNRGLTVETSDSVRRNRDNSRATKLLKYSDPIKKAEFVKKVSDTLKQGYLTGRVSVAPSKKILYKDTKFKSEWEVLAAKFFDKRGWSWEYEKKRFKVIFPNNAEHVYISDFYLPEFDKHIEVKGRWKSEENKQKYELFKKQYPDLNTSIWGLKQIEHLKRYEKKSQKNMEIKRFL